jgi:hypothetical protein
MFSQEGYWEISANLAHVEFLNSSMEIGRLTPMH